jgi:AhpD family alkylhydroperoxidase
MRIDYTREFPAARQAMLGLERTVHSSSLEPLLLELVKIRASQLNGCAHCLEMHTKDAGALAATTQTWATATDTPVAEIAHTALR